MSGKNAICRLTAARLQKSGEKTKTSDLLREAMGERAERCFVWCRRVFDGSGRGGRYLRGGRFLPSTVGLGSSMLEAVDTVAVEFCSHHQNKIK